jgi:tetratricopeptide (TPR) repeat protein
MPVRKVNSVTVRKRNKKDANDRREEILRPSPYLGYDRDNLGMHLMSCEAYEIAETQFRRAIWLNPYEKKFLTHLAWCLHRQGRSEESHKCLAGIPLSMMSAEMKSVLRFVEGETPGRRCGNTS